MLCEGLLVMLHFFPRACMCRRNAKKGKWRLDFFCTYTSIRHALELSSCTFLRVWQGRCANSRMFFCVGWPNAYTRLLDLLLSPFNRILCSTLEVKRNPLVRWKIPKCSAGLAACGLFSLKCLQFDSNIEKKKEYQKRMLVDVLSSRALMHFCTLFSFRV